MGKRGSALIALILCMCLFLTIPPRASATTGDEIRAAKKIISVVYDDSTSMYGDRWVYANYATQALTALLNAQDELYITYMSSPHTSQSVSLADIDRAVTGIRNWGNAGGTPKEALETARAKLDGISENDPSTQFWLIILTDGGISGIKDKIQATLNSYKGDKMPNGSTLNVVYMAMGAGAISASSDAKKGLHAFSADNPAEITSAMAEIANMVSSRMNADNIKQVDDKTISFRSELPLYSISVLTQQSSAKVLSAKSSEETLNIDRNITLDSRDPFGKVATYLYGNAAVINLLDAKGTGRVIEADTYTITFSEPVDVKNLLVQYEPAIGLKMLVTRDGIEITDTSKLGKDEKVSIELIPVVPGTDQRISDSSLPQNISWQIDYIVDGNVADSGTSKTLTGVVLLPGDSTIRGTMQIPGFAPSVYDLYFPVPDIVYNFGIRKEQPQPLEFGRKATNGESLDGSKLIFHITNDGIPMTRDEQKAAGVKLKIDSVTCDNSMVTGFFASLGKFPASCALKQNDNGSYTLAPRPVVPFTAFLTMPGAYTVTVSVSSDPGITETGTFTLIVQASDASDLIKLGIALLVLIYLIYIIFFRYRFTGQTVSYREYKLTSTRRGIPVPSNSDQENLSPWIGFFSLRRASRYEFHDVILQAGPRGTVFINGKSIAEAVSYYSSDSMDPENHLRTIVQGMQETKQEIDGKEVSIAANQPLFPESPVYFRTNETDTTIWCITLE